MKRFEFRAPWLFLAFAFLLLLGLAMASEGVYDSGDGILHYEFAHFSWKHPELFLDHWAKPFFTLLSSPFAQFGYKGMLLFNILISLSALYITWQIAEVLGLKNAGLAMPLLLFAPVYLGCSLSGLTEPLFACVMSGGVYLILKNRTAAAALLLSFLPLVRSEGFMLLPIWGLWLLAERKFIHAVLLASGSILFSLVGGLYFRDVFWLFNRNPYTGAAESYGHGSLFHFIGSNEYIFGWVLAGLMLAGIATFFYSLFRTKDRGPLLRSGVLILLPFFVYFSAHSIFWWKGLASSLGLLRVIAAVMPSAAILALYGLNGLKEILFDKLKYPALVLLPLFLLHAYMPFKVLGIPFRLGREQKLSMQVSCWLKENQWDHHRIWVQDPLVLFDLEKDPWDTNQVVNLYYYREGILKKDDLLIWESHYAVNEARIPLEMPERDSTLQIIGEFDPGVLLKRSNGKEERLKAVIFKR